MSIATSAQKKKVPKGKFRLYRDSKAINAMHAIPTIKTIRMVSGEMGMMIPILSIWFMINPDQSILVEKLKYRKQKGPGCPGTFK